MLERASSNGEEDATHFAQRGESCGAPREGGVRDALHGEVRWLREASRPWPDPFPGHDCDGLHAGRIWGQPEMLWHF